MKVLIITSTVHEKSGWGRYSRAITVHLQKQGIELELFTEQKPEALDCIWHHLAPLSSRISFFAFIQNCLAVRRAAKNVEVIHALDGWPFGVYGYMAVLGTRKKLFINGVGTYSVAPLYSLFRGVLLRAAYARAHKIFTISEYTKKEIEAGGVSAENILTVYPGRNDLPHLSLEETNELRARYGIPENAYPIVLTVGAIKDRKGQLKTLGGVEILKEKYPDILYVIAGSGGQASYMRDIEQYAAERKLGVNILILKEVSDTTLSFLYSVCTVFALNSTTDSAHHHFEGFGMAVVEAYQFGKPAVGSLGSGIEDAIADGKTGFLTQQGDAQDIADKIEKILERYDFFSGNAKMHYADFDWQKTVEEYSKWY